MKTKEEKRYEENIKDHAGSICLYAGDAIGCICSTAGKCSGD